MIPFESPHQFTGSSVVSGSNAGYAKQIPLNLQSRDLNLCSAFRVENHTDFINGRNRLELDHGMDSSP